MGQIASAQSKTFTGSIAGRPVRRRIGRVERHQDDRRTPGGKSVKVTPSLNDAADLNPTFAGEQANILSF
jgi:hypothetical protein